MQLQEFINASVKDCFTKGVISSREAQKECTGSALIPVTAKTGKMSYIQQQLNIVY